MDITEQEIKDKVAALRNLVSSKGKSDEVLTEEAKKILESNEADVDISSMFTDRKETKRARGLLKKYLEDYSIRTISDRNTLREVIYLEIVQQRLQEKLNEFYSKDGKAVPLQLVELIHKNSEAILKLKFSLGLGRTKEEKQTGLNIINSLKERFVIWRSENQGSRTLTCPHCGKMIMLKIRTDMWEAQKHPFFKDRLLANEHLLKLYKKKIISKRDIAKILECSTDYIDWIIDKLSGRQQETISALTNNSQESGTIVPSDDTQVSNEAKKGEEDMLMSAEKIARENRCPKCEVGFLTCSLSNDKFIENCTNCDYTAEHICRREKQETIDFEDRRNNIKAPSSLESEEKEN